MSTETFGDFRDDLIDRLDHLAIELHPGKVQLRWIQCALIGDLLADYCEYAFPAEETSESPLLDRRDMSHSINYVANELLENAVKFRSGGIVRLAAGLVDQEVVLVVDNRLAAARAKPFQAVLQEITQGDPGELLIRKIEANANGDSGEGSGLGFLTMMSDYGVAFGWRFTDSLQCAETVELSTMARLRTRKDV